jgi:hypothetical protein
VRGGVWLVAQEAFKESSKTNTHDYDISSSDCLMSALAMFSLKYPSLLKFDESCHEK